MAFALALVIPFATEEEKERVLDLFEAISRETFLNENENIAYCWYRKSLDSPLEGPTVCGLEIYEQERSLTEIHRAGEAYKHMRAVAPTEKLFLRPSPLTFLEPAIPAELCFLTKDGTDVHFDRKRESSTYVILTQYFPETSDARTMLKKKLKELAEAAIGDESVLTFYPLRHRTADVGNDEDKGAITVFERYGSHAEYEGQSAMVRELTEEARTAVERFEVSTWTDGVGHIRGKRITQT